MGNQDFPYYFQLFENFQKNKKNMCVCFQNCFFFDEKIKVEKKLDHHFDVEFCQESI